MKITELKRELNHLIENEKDIDVLTSIKMLLEQAQHNIQLREKLVSRALKSEEDIKANRLFTKEDIIRETENLIEN